MSHLPRLRRLAADVTGAAATGAVAPAWREKEDSGRPAALGMRLLAQTQVENFIEHGYVLLPLDELPDAFHSELYRKCERRWVEEEGRNGKEIFKEIPELHRVLASETLQGGLASVLGPDYTMHPARHMHVSGDKDGGYHKDGGHCSIRHHRPR